MHGPPSVSFNGECPHSLSGNIDISGNRPPRHVEVRSPINLCWGASFPSFSTVFAELPAQFLSTGVIYADIFSGAIIQRQALEPEEMYADLQIKGFVFCIFFMNYSYYLDYTVK